MEEMGHSPGCTTAAEKESQEELSLPNKNAAGSPPAKRQPTAPQPQSTLKGSSPPSDGGGRLDVLARLEAMAAFDLAPGERVRDLILSEYLEMADIISEFLGTRIFFLCEEMSQQTRPFPFPQKRLGWKRLLLRQEGHRRQRQEDLGAGDRRSWIDG